MKTNKSAVLFAMCLLCVCGSARVFAEEYFNYDVNNDSKINVLDVMQLKNNIIGGDNDGIDNVVELKNIVLRGATDVSQVTTTAQESTTSTTTTPTPTTTQKVTTTTTQAPVTEAPVVVTEAPKSEKDKTPDDYRAEGRNNIYDTYAFGASPSERAEMDEIYNNILYSVDWCRQFGGDDSINQTFWDLTYDLMGGHHDRGTGDWNFDDIASHIGAVSAYLYGYSNYDAAGNAYLAMTEQSVDCDGDAQWACYMVSKSGYTTRYCESSSISHGWGEVYVNGSWRCISSPPGSYPDDTVVRQVYIP